MTYYIGFFKYEDSDIYMKSGMSTVRDEIYDYLNNADYVDKKSIQIKEFELED